MATLNLGRIKPVFRGAYAGGTAYVVDDIVTSGNETFICILASTGNATSNATYWTKLAAKGTDGTDVGATITTQGDILYRDGSGLQRLAKPASDKFLQNTSGGVLSWADAGGGKVNQVVQTQYTGQVSWSGTSWAEISTDLRVAITPSAATSKILYWGSIVAGVNGNYGWMKVVRNLDSTDTDIALNTTCSGGQIVASSGGWNQMNSSTATMGSIVWLDTPNTTNECIYKLYGWAHNTSYMNRGSNNNNDTNVAKGVTTITAMEILA